VLHTVLLHKYELSTSSKGTEGFTTGKVGEMIMRRDNSIFNDCFNLIFTKHSQCLKEVCMRQCRATLAARMKDVSAVLNSAA